MKIATNVFTAIAWLIVKIISTISFNLLPKASQLFSLTSPQDFQRTYESTIPVTDQRNTSKAPGFMRSCYEAVYYNSTIKIFGEGGEGKISTCYAIAG